MAQTYTYYVHDNASFRSAKPFPYASADEVLAKGVWVAYEGDTLEPVVYGRRVDEKTARKFDSLPDGTASRGENEA